MITITRSYFALVAFSAVLGVALVGCDDSPPTPSAPSPSADPLEEQLSLLREATAPYQELVAAESGGWDTQFTPCMKHATGAMGFHYVKRSALDATVSFTDPEALIYEPGADGKMRLVAVEFLIPFTHHAADQPPPTIYGLTFSPSPTFKVWGLHAWVWKDNPLGMFAPWNPTVVCP